MRKHRVLLLSDQPLLGEGLANLLGQIEGVEVIGPRSTASFVLTDLSTCMPDVVVFAEQDADDLMADAVMLQILRHSPDLPVIQIDLSDNSIAHVYTSHTLPARSTDLIDMIRSLPQQGQTHTVSDCEE